MLKCSVPGLCRGVWLYELSRHDLALGLAVLAALERVTVASPLLTFMCNCTP